MRITHSPLIISSKNQSQTETTQKPEAHLFHHYVKCVLIFSTRLSVTFLTSPPLVTLVPSPAYPQPLHLSQGPAVRAVLRCRISLTVRTLPPSLCLSGPEVTVGDRNARAVTGFLVGLVITVSTRERKGKKHNKNKDDLTPQIMKILPKNYDNFTLIEDYLTKTLTIHSSSIYFLCISECLPLVLIVFSILLQATL